MDGNIEEYYPKGITQTEADELFTKEWTRDFGVRLQMQKEGIMVSRMPQLGRL